MAQRTFTLTATVPVVPSAAIDFLMDLSRHFGLHPYVVSAVVTSSGEDAEGRWWDWRVVERPKLGPIRYTIRFPARMIRTSATTMIGRVRAAPGCTLLTSTKAEVIDGKTVVTETTITTTPPGLNRYMSSEAELAHARTFSLLPTELAKA
jgi:hypothetical protein